MQHRFILLSGSPEETVWGNKLAGQLRWLYIVHLCPHSETYPTSNKLPAYQIMSLSAMIVQRAAQEQEIVRTAAL
jgi:hypothetical protein